MFKDFLIFFVLLPFFLAGCKQPQEKQLRLWDDAPAVEWTDALPVGNGRIGAMVFGKPDSERIQLNDDALWPGSAEWTNPAGTKKDLQKIRELLFSGNKKRADQLLVEKFSRKNIGRSHQTMGDLFIDLDHNNISDYRRELNLNEALVSVRYKMEGELVTQQVFASHPDQCIIIAFHSEAKQGLSGKIRLSRPLDNGQPTVKIYTKDRQLIMDGQVTQHNAWFDSKETQIEHGVKFQTRLATKNRGGEVIFHDDYLQLQNVNDLTLYLVSNNSFCHDNFADVNSLHLNNAMQKGFSALLADHKQDYQHFFDRVELSLAGDDPDSLSTKKRLQRVKKGETDYGLQTLLFQYGRYLLISSSRPGTNPANLQGLWNKDIMAPWNADYHLNINLQMNYWLADVTDLSEMNEPLFNYVDRLIERGKTTAKENYGCRGSFLPHASDLWAPTFLRASTAYWGGSFGAAGWMMQHYWQHFRFTEDTLFLRERVYPALNEVAHFYFDWLVQDPRDGSWISVPSTSPENRYIAEGDTVATCLGSAMDQQIIAEVFDNYIEACRILSIQSSFLDSLKSKRENLRSGLVIGNDGRILEWDREYEEYEKGHRHMSHLYAFHPGDAVNTETPDLYQAARKTLEYRLSHGGGHTGWSRAWLINLYARLLDGDLAHENIQLLIQKSLYSNLFDAHPPFQIDGNFGYTAGIAEMLLQSHQQNTIQLLPALPSAWSAGYVKGLKARGNYIVEMEWSDNQLHKAIIQAVNGGKTNIIYKDQQTVINLKAGETYTLAL